MLKLLKKNNLNLFVLNVKLNKQFQKMYIYTFFENSILSKKIQNLVLHKFYKFNIIFFVTPLILFLFLIFYFSHFFFIIDLNVFSLINNKFTTKILIKNSIVSNYDWFKIFEFLT